MPRMTLSVVMPNYNHAKYLPRSIRAIAEQTRPPDEFLILDDASTDDSVAVIEEHAARYPFVRFLRNERNAGVNAAHRRLFELASGDFVHGAAADDDRYPTFFERAMEMAGRYPRTGIVFGELDVKNDHDQRIGEVVVQRWKEPLYADPERFLHDYLQVELASHSASGATIYRRGPFAEVGWYRDELGPWADTFAARALGLKYGAAFVPERFAIDYRYPGSYSQQAKDEPRRALDIVRRAAALMRSEEFRDRFPEAHVRHWETQFRRLIAWQYFLGPAQSPRPGFLMRNLARLPRLVPALSLLLERGRS